MNINEDILKKAAVHARTSSWKVDKRRKCEVLYLDLLDKVKPVATMIVRMPPSTAWRPETLSGGKEVYVLEGTFQDERGAYPKGSYMRFPPGTRQQGFSDTGCLLFVKTWQFKRSDRRLVNIDAAASPVYRPYARSGVSVQPVFGDDREDVRLEHWSANHRMAINQINGLELLVLNGQIHEPSITYKQYSWLRIPPNQSVNLIVGDIPARVLIKESHLVHAVPGRPALKVGTA